MPVSPHNYVRISSTDDLSYTVPSTSSADTHDAIQTIVTGRKCWKTIKGKGEVVWPPYLEAALVEGLEKYRPVETRSARALGRFPMRNKFISDYIFNVTGKRRTPKQVGSRLQQLRDTCEGKRILKLLSRRPGDPQTDEESTQGAASAAPVGPTREYVTIDILPDNIPWSAASASPSASASSFFNGPRPIRTIDNTVTFKCATALPAASYSSSRVLKDTTVVHQETTALEMCSSSCTPGQWNTEPEVTFLYSTRLVPQFWARFYQLPDLSSYSVVQRVIRSPSSDATAAGASGTPSPPLEDVVFEVVYRFNTSQSSVPQSPVSSNGDGTVYSAESSPELSTYDEYNMPNAGSGLRHEPVVPRSFPQSNQRQYQHPQQSQHHDPHSFELPPGLIHPGEEGYASLPQSPLDLGFGATAGIGAGADSADNICRSFGDCNLDYSGGVSFDNGVGIAHGPGGLVGPGYSVNVNVPPYNF